MEKKHTPGPWECHAEDLRGGRYWVVTGPQDEVDLADEWNGEADARLMAAAPELLAMLKMAQLWLDVDGRYDMQGINAAIAKAEGRP